MPPGSGAAPGRFVKAVKRGNKIVKHEAAYLGGVIVFNADPGIHASSTNKLYQQLPKNNLKLPLEKWQLKVIEAGFFGHSISITSVSRNASKIAVLAETPAPEDANNYALYWVISPIIGSFSSSWQNRVGPSVFLLEKALN